MEHLQKIPYLLLFFLPIAIFLGFGLWLAYWHLYKHARALNVALEENRKLQEKLSSLGTGDLSSLKSKLSAKLEDSQREWELKLSDTKNELSAKGDLLLTREKELEDSQVKLNALLSTEKDLKLKLDAEAKKTAELDLNFGNYKAEKEKEYNLLLEDKKKLQADLEGGSGTVEALEEKLVQLQSDYDRMELEKKSNSQTITNLIAKVDALEAEKTALAENDNSGEIDALNAKIGDLEAQLSSKESELGNLNAKIDGGDLSIFGAGLGLAGLGAAAGGKLGLGDIKTQLGDLEAQLSAKDAELGDLKAQLEASGHAQAELGDLNAKLGDLEAQLSAKDAELGDLKAQLEASGQAQAELGDLNAKLGDLEAQLSAKDAELGDLNAQLEASGQAQAELGDLNAKLGDLEAQLSAKDAELGELNAKIDGGDLSIFGAGLGLAGLGATAGGKLGLGDIKTQLGDLEAQLSDKDAEISTLKAELDAGASSKIDASSLTPAAFFTGTAATQHDRYGYVYGQRADAEHVDDLTEIKGVGEVLQPKLNEFGVYQFKQIALWDQENIDAFQEDLNFPGRVEREQWVNQAADLHRKHYNEPLAPVVDIYKPAKPRTSVKDAGPSLADFEGDDVKADEKLGILYNSKPDEVDDLKKISGVAGVLEGKLNDFGVYRYKQIALWNKNNIDEFSEGIGFPDRIERDQWIAQSLNLHHDKYGERLAPRHTVFHHVPAQKKTGKSTAQLKEEFKGEDVEVSDELGVIYKSRPAQVDDLKKIKGVANVLEGELHKIGIYRFKQIANWEVNHMAEFSQRLAFPGRIERDDWKSQAKQFHKEKYNEEA